jgi:hypothetical protein
LQAPAPSFVEAVAGETNPTPPPAAIQNALELATRLIAAEKATPLNLLGGVSEQPDFLVSPEVLPYVFAMRGDRDWKRGPRDKSSPLVVDSWKVLKREGALTVPELQEELGREVTEAAVLRSLSELWAALRVLPVYSAGEDTAWELFESRHQKAMQIGGGMAQATALSALVSLYLDSAIAATTEEIETFLSPLTQSLLHIAGGLPEFPEIEAPAEPQPQPEATPRERRPFAPRSPSDRGPRRERPSIGERPAARDQRKAASPGWKRPASEPPRKEWKPRTDRPVSDQGESRPRRASGDAGFKKPFRPRTGEQSSGPSERKEWKPRPQQGEFRPRREGTSQGGFKKPYRSREGEQPREFRPRRAEGGAGFSKPFRKRAEGEGPAGKFPPRDRDSQRPPRKEWKLRREGGAGEERREIRPRRTGESTERREFKPRSSAGGGFRPRREASGSAGRSKPAGEKRFGERRPFESREGFDRKKPPQRERRVEGGDAERPRKSFSRPGSKSGKSFGGPKSGGRKPSFGAKRPGRLGSKPSFGKRPNNKKGKKSGE